MHKKISMLRFAEGGDGGESGSGAAAVDGQEGAKPEAQQQDALGEPGKKALDAERAARKTAEDALKSLQATVDQMKAAQTAQTDALAKALGVKPDEVSDADKVAADLSDLRNQLGTLQRTNTLLAAGIDAETEQKYAHLLNATDPATLALQAQTVAELVKATTAATAPPAFQQIAGQGQQSGDASIADQIAAAQKEAGAAVPGSAEQRAAMARAMQLKSQQLAALKP